MNTYIDEITDDDILHVARLGIGIIMFPIIVRTGGGILVYNVRKPKDFLDNDDLVFQFSFPSPFPEDKRGCRIQAYWEDSGMANRPCSNLEKIFSFLFAKYTFQK